MNKQTVLLGVLALAIIYTACAQQYDSESDFQVSLLEDGKSVEITKYVGNKQTVNIPPRIEGVTVTKIGGEAFNGYSSLASITIPVGVTTIGNHAFPGCSSLTSITLPVGLTSIGHFAFIGCTSLTSINIPASVTSIGVNAFYGCTSLASITVNNRNPSYSSKSGILYDKTKTQLIAYPSASGAITIPNTVTSIGGAAFQGCENLISITLSASVTTIGIGAFSGCKSLASITIPASVTSIGVNAFTGCTGLTTITVDANNPHYSSEGGILYNKAKTELIAYPSASGNVTIPEGVISIGNHAFLNCTGLTSITLPVSVTSIGRQAFYGCTSLTSINIPASVTAIDNGAFSYSSQTINIEGKANQAAADRAWGAGWRSNCNAKINYLGQ